MLHRLISSINKMITNNQLKTKNIIKIFELILIIFTPTITILIVLISFLYFNSLTIETLLYLILLLLITLLISIGITRLSSFIIEKETDNFSREDLLNNILKIEKKIDLYYRYWPQNIKLLTAAKMSGIVEIFPDRDNAFFNSIIEEINTTKGPIDICMVKMNFLQNIDRLAKVVADNAMNYDTRILLLDPDCEEAKRLDKIERTSGVNTIKDIKYAIEWLKNKMAQNMRINIHLYSIPSMLSILLTKNYLFLEPYHYNRFIGVEKGIGGNVPILKIINDRNNSYHFFKTHFDYLWRDSHGGKVNLDFQVTDYKSGNYITIVNNNDFDIEMKEWGLAAHGVQNLFKFNQDFVWIKKQKINIYFNNQSSKKVNFIWNISDLPDNTILTMQNRNNTTVAQWAPLAIRRGSVNNSDPKKNKLIDFYFSFKELPINELSNFLKNLEYIHINLLSFDSPDQSIQGIDKYYINNLLLSEIFTGNSLNISLKEGWIPDFKVNDGSINISIPKKIGIPAMIGFFLLNAARYSMNLHNEFLDGKIKELDYEIKKIEYMEKLKSQDLKAIENSAEKTIKDLKESKLIYNFKIYNIPIINRNKD